MAAIKTQVLAARLLLLLQSIMVDTISFSGDSTCCQMMKLLDPSLLSHDRRSIAPPGSKSGTKKWEMSPSAPPRNNARKNLPRKARNISITSLSRPQHPYLHLLAVMAKMKDTRFKTAQQRKIFTCSLLIIKLLPRSQPA